jgi:hypothetical protein
MEVEPRLWRLLSDCERLSQDEWVALREHDFDTVDRIQTAKAALFVDLQLLSAQSQCQPRDEALVSRFAGLIAAEERNLLQVNSMLGEARVARQDLFAANQRLRELAIGYGSEIPSPIHFLAHG